MKVAQTSTALRVVGFLAVIFSLYHVTTNRLDHLRLSNEAARQGFISAEDRTKQLACLTKNIYYEAAFEPFEGKVAVAQVTMNRVASGAFHSTVCGVVYAYKQFSWTLDNTRKIRDRKAWEASVDLAVAVLTRSIPLPNFSALYFHTKQVRPHWNRNKRVVAVIGNHIFYS